MTTRILTLCLAAVAVGAPGFARQEPNKPAQQPPIPTLEEKVVHVYRADQLQGLLIKGAGDQEVGKLDGMLVDSSNGQIAFAVIAEGGMLGVGEHQRLVPWTALHFRAKDDKQKNECEAAVLLSQAELAACPSFKRGEAISAENERKAFECAKLPPDPNPGRRQAGQLQYSADVDGCKVQCKGQTDIGVVEHVLVDPMEARVAYLVLDTSGAPGMTGKHIAMPWQATQSSLDKEQKLLLTTTQAKERIDGAPVYVDKDVKRMTNSTWIRELGAYYGVEPYWVRAGAAPAKPAIPPAKPANPIER